MLFPDRVDESRLSREGFRLDACCEDPGVTLGQASNQVVGGKRYVSHLDVHGARRLQAPRLLFEADEIEAVGQEPCSLKIRRDRARRVHL